MNIIQGRGKNRRNLITIPTGEFVRKAPEDQQEAVRSFICDAVGIPSTIHPIDATLSV